MINIKDKVSIVIPIYNKETYILYTLESIKEQIYANYEIIIVNDGSTDNSVSIINSFIKENNLEIKIINQKNHGVSYARNVGIKNSTGEYIFFLDGDDILDKLCIENLVKEMKKNDSDMSVCGYYVYVNNKIIDESNILSKSIFTNIVFLNMFIKNNLHIYMGNALYIRRIIVNNKVYFNDKYKYNEDQVFIYNYLINCNKIIFDPAKNFKYLRSTDSVTMKPEKEKFTDVQIFIEFYNELKEKNNHQYDEVLKNLKCNKIPISIYNACHNFITLNCKFKELNKIINDNLPIFRYIKNYSIKYGKKKYIKIKILQNSPKLFYYLVRNSFF